MKRIILILVAILGASHMWAQNINPEFDHVEGRRHAAKNWNRPADSTLSHWCIDVNGMAGVLTQQITAIDPTANYTNLLNPKVSSLKYENGGSYGLDAQVGYFFGKMRHFGLGTGLTYMYQHGDLTMDNFHVEYQSVDALKNVFRQEITADGKVKETTGTSNLNIPLVLKYKTMFSKRVGFTVDAGVLFNLVESNDYKAKTAFDYEAIYKYAPVNGVISNVYETSVVPASSDLLITKAQYVNQYPNGNIQDYFNSLQNHGYNVGLGVKPYNNSGTVSYTGSVGVLLRPAISIYLCHNVALNLGAYYLYQDFSHTASGGYRLTDKVGQYSSVMNTVTGSSNNSYGLNVGLRFFFGRAAGCVAPPPPVEEPKEEVEEAVPAPEKIVPPTPEVPQREDAVTPPEAPEPQEINVAVTPILFDVDKTVIKESSYPTLDEAASIIQGKNNAYYVIHGYADNTGTAPINWLLSRHRANAVRTYLHSKGVSLKLLKTVAHGAKSPVASNDTEEGRAQNRRVMIELKEKK